MSFFESILLGFIQGITEFLPISSSGHLVIFQNILSFSQPPIFFDILLHTATLCAVVIYFRKKLVNYLSLSNLKIIIVASIPASIAGVFLSPYIEEIFNSLFIVGFGLTVTGILLLITKTIPSSKSNKVTNKKAAYIGLFQAAALIPGVSRSGSTIFGSLINKISRKKAFEFSFIMSIPVIFGALVLQIFSTKTITFTYEYLAGFITAFISGLLAIKVLDFIISNERLHYFGYYCLVLGATVLLVAV